MGRWTLAAGIAAIVVLGLVAAGCGGDDKKGYAMTKAEYASALNKICADFNAKQEEIGEPQNLADVVEKGPQIVEEFDKAIAAAEDLDAPDEVQEDADRFIELGHEQRDLVQELIDAAQDDDQAKVNEIGSKIEPLDNESDEIASRIGSPACAEE